MTWMYSSTWRLTDDFLALDQEFSALDQDILALDQEIQRKIKQNKKNNKTKKNQEKPCLSLFVSRQKPGQNQDFLALDHEVLALDQAILALDQEIQGKIKQHKKNQPKPRKTKKK